MRIGSIPGVKRPGCGVDHPAQTNADVKERVELYICFPLGLHGMLYGEDELF